MTERQQADSDRSTAIARALALVATYHASARAELIQRVGHRDTSITLFLGATAVVLGAAFRGDGLDKGDAVLLLVIPLLGFGATLIHVQHNGVIGTIGEYLGIELRETTRALMLESGLRPDLMPADWDSSDTLFGVRTHILNRRWSALTLLVAPQIVAVLLAAAELPADPASAIGTYLAVAAIALSLYSLNRSHIIREERIVRLREHKAAEHARPEERSPEGSSGQQPDAAVWE
nr:MetaGeneMark_Unknown Function [uncultured bacterium]